MSQVERLFNYLQENDSNPSQFGTLEQFSEEVKNPNQAELLRQYLNNEQFGDSTMFYNELNKNFAPEIENPTQENIESPLEDVPISFSTTEGPNDILHNELNNPGSSLDTLASIASPDYESNQRISSSDYGLFQINDKYWSDTSNQLFNKGIADQSIEENIGMAAYIAKNDPRGWNNWVAYNKQKHKEFDGITDEEIVSQYGVAPEVIQLINESFDDPQTAKQVMLAESGGKQDAINVNYTPQSEGNEEIPLNVQNQSQSIINQTQQRFPQMETAQPSSTDFVSDEEQAMYPTFKLEGTNIAQTLKKATESYLALESPNWETAPFKDLKPVAQFGVNVLSHLAEIPGLAIDIPTQLATSPEETLYGLISFFPEEFNKLLLASNVYDVTNPVAGLFGLDVSREELANMRKKAQKHIYDTGGVYTFMAAHGLTNLGVKTRKIAEKNAEFRDVVKDANGETPSKPLSKEGKKASDALKKNPELNEKAKQAIGEQLELDLIEPKKVEQILEKAEKQTSTEVNLDRDVPSQGVEIGELGLEGKVVSVKRFYDRKNKIHTIQKLDKNGNQIGEAQYAPNVKEAQKTVNELKVEYNIKKGEKQTSTEVNLDRDVPDVIFDKKNNVAKELKKVEKKVKEITEKVKSEDSKKSLEQKQQKKKPKKKQKKQEVLQEQKITKSSDFKITDGFESIKGEPTRRYKSLDGVKEYVASKLPEYVGDNVIATYAKTTKGDYLVRMLKVKKDAPKEMIAAKSGQKKIGPEMPEELVTSMRDPRSGKRRIQNRDVLLEKYEAEIGELGRNLKSTINEVAKLEQQALETGVQSPRLDLLKNSIDSINRTISKSQNNIRQIMTSKQLVTRIASNIGKKTASGQIGGNAKKSKKQKQIDAEISADIRQLWENSKTGLKITKKNLINYLREIGASKEVIKYANKNYKRLADETLFENAKKLSNEIDAEYSSIKDPVKGTRTKYRKPDEYIGNMRVDIIGGNNPNNYKLAQVDILKNIIEKIGGEEVAKTQGRTTLKAIERDASSQKIMGEMIHEVFHKSEITLNNLPAKTASLVNMLSTLLTDFAKTNNADYRPLIERAALAYQEIASQFGRTGRVIRDLKAKEITDWKVFEDMFAGDVSLVEVLKDITSNKELTRSRLFKLAEWGRNAKLATGSSIVRSTIGNAYSSVDAFGRMFFEFGNDWLIRKTSGALYELSNGFYGNLSKNQMNKLELGAQVSGYYQGFPQGVRLAFEMLKENDAVLKESSFFAREGLYYKDIGGTTGVVVRTPQRVQGAIDLLFRVPLTNAYMKKGAIRQAIKEGKKTQSEIQQRAIEIMEKGELDAKYHKEAINSAEYVTFQRELGSLTKSINQLRTGNTRGAAVAQMIVPFFNTAANLFKYTVEHTPLGVFYKDFRRGVVDAFSPTGKGSRGLATELAKMQTGTLAIMVLNELLVDNSSGNITGDWSNDAPEERNMKTNNGQQEYSIKAGDGWVSYRGFEPLSSYLTLINSYHRTKDTSKMNKQELTYHAEQVRNATYELAKSFADNPFLAGFEDLFKVREGRKDALDYLFSFSAGMLIPGTIRQIDSIIDPVRRKKLKKSDIDENVDWVEVMQSQAKQVFPWFSKNLDYLDPFGNEIEKPDPVGGLFAFRYTEAKNDPVYAEIQKIYFDQDKRFQPARPMFTSTELAKINYTPEEHFALIKITGQQLYSYIQDIMQTEVWQTMKPAIKRQQINSRREDLYNINRAILFNKYLPIAEEMKIEELEGNLSTSEERKEFVRKAKKKKGLDRMTVDEIFEQYEQLTQ